ncbi:sigma 54-interacting transcriptional regulator [Deltaproteobacteria bacterium OttesenSCG-928-K17]|nr:sigma 54-interacting transcriptional regulator [Deltaproteobacteria bacterium OttesenSCG-928-K17]
MAQLFAFREDRLGFHFEVKEKAVLGRAPDCDLLIFDRSASRHHCEIFMVDDKYFIADMGSTNGTMVNDKAITMQTRLEPYDSIKIGQELFIFEPGLEVVVGPAPSAIIIDSPSEEVNNLITAPAEQAAAAVAPEDAPALMALAHRLGQLGKIEEIEEVIFRYMSERFRMTFSSVLWPSRPPAKRLISMLTSHEDKRLLLSLTPFIRATRDREALLWPKTIVELTFNEGRRQVSQDSHPSLIGPLVADGNDVGLMYLENHDEPFTEKDMNAFAAMLGIISPSIARLANYRFREAEQKTQPDAASEFFSSAGDDKIKILLATAAQAAEGNGSVLLTGEAGTGKSALAEFIHNISPRKNARLVTVNLATLPPADIESTLFGQAATEGVFEQAGLVEMADGGTLFLRHVENLPPSTQKLLLMTIEEGIFFNLGASRPKAVDLRVISSTSTDLWRRVQSGYFREDLYARLNKLNISLTPLRETRHDLDTLVNNFMARSARDMGLSFTGIDSAAMECLRAYSWPGNFAELRMEASLLVLFSRNGRVALDDLPAHLRMSGDTFMGDDGEQPPPLILEAERHQLVAAMSRCSGDLEAVASLLGQRAEHIIMKMRALNLDPMDYQGPIHMGGQINPGQTSLPKA